MQKIIILILILESFVNLSYAQDSTVSRIPLIGEPAPKFTAESTNGKITFPMETIRNGPFFSVILQILQQYAVQRFLN